NKTFELGAEDSGEEGAPIIYRAAKKGAAVFYAGTRVAGWTPVKDAAVLGILPESSRSKVWQTDLKSQGITDYGELKVRGFDAGSPSVPAIELFADGKPMTLSRWPNEGFTNISDIPLKDGHAIHGYVGSKTPKFNYSGERPRRWSAEKDIWVLGYFFWDWAEGQRKVESIDLEKHEITLADAKSSYGFRKDQRFFAYNLLSEIDMPGEWYLDRQTGILYLYPSGDPNKTVLELSMLSTAMAVLKNVSHVRFEGLAFDLARANAVEVTGGTDVLFSGCKMTRLAGGGIRIEGGERHGILGCEIGMLGRNGTWITGGDRKTLKPSGHFIENCHIYSNSRLDPTYTPGVLLNGVGMKMAHNLIHDCPSSAARIEGNEHLV
ncbi:MAG: right-handed parallel beta-helix repeat-containing protein, partial [Spirochaetia bacterium]|nr:right-handed parallel beta-helix repeat-containing protein [Spirochaetia bacterium]